MVPLPAQPAGKEPPVARDAVPTAPVEQPVVPREAVPGTRDTQQAIAELVQRFLQASTRNLEFYVEEASGKPVIVVRDAEGQVIRQIPGEEALRMMRRMNAQSGTLFDSIA